MKKILFSILILAPFLAEAQAIDVNGDWRGKIKQEVERKGIEYFIQASFKQLSNNAIGEMVFTLEEIPMTFSDPMNKRKIHILNMTAEIVDDKYIYLNYHNSDRTIRQYGSVVLEIKSNSLLEGRFLGYGAETRKIIDGEMSFER